MIPGRASRRIIADRLEWVETMLDRLHRLPLDDRDRFFADVRNVAAAESYLRRALEALLDLGRHILAKGFGKGVSEYKEIARELKNHGVLTRDEADRLETMAGYRNRMVHFYHEVSREELYEICRHHLADVEDVLHGYKRWARQNPDRVDDQL